MSPAAIEDPKIKMNGHHPGNQEESVEWSKKCLEKYIDPNKSLKDYIKELNYNLKIWWEIGHVKLDWRSQQTIPISRIERTNRGTGIYLKKHTIIAMVNVNNGDIPLLNAL